jgi:hypothetical protein
MSHQDLTMRWSERLAALFLTFDESPPSTRSEALTRQPSLILFSLGAMTRLILAILLFTSAASSAQTLIVDELLQSPRQFEGRRVSVRGYYESDWEGHSLWADRAAAKRADFSRSIWIAADPNVESPLRKAEIIGVFFYSRVWRPRTLGGMGHMGLFPAALINCTVHLQREATSAPNQAMQRTPTRRSHNISND